MSAKPGDPRVLGGTRHLVIDDDHVDHIRPPGLRPGCHRGVERVPVLALALTLASTLGVREPGKADHRGKGHQGGLQLEKEWSWESHGFSDCSWASMALKRSRE